MPRIPPTKDSDPEDVVWGLQTAEALWKRGERIDAIVWLRRAAQAAGEDDDRALELARAAAELSDWMAARPLSVRPSQAPLDDENEDPHRGNVTYVPSSGPVSVEVELESELESEGPRGSRPAFPPPDLPPPPLRAPALTSPMLEPPEEAAPPDEDVVDEEPPRESTSVPPAERVHAGMFNPWDEQTAPAAEAPGRPPTGGEEEDEGEVLTSLRPLALSSDAPPSLQPSSVAPVAEPIAKKPPPRPPPLPPGARKAPRDDAQLGVPAPPPPPAVPPPTPEKGLDLSEVEAFADLPDDAREAFAAAAEVSALGEGEEVSSFALAYILAGAVDVAATMVDAPAARLEAGAVLRARGTTDDGVPMRLIGVSSGVVATWTAAAVDDAFRTCPWVEEDLRLAADRIQTLVGVTIGPLGERIDASIRAQIIARLTMRTLAPGEVVVSAGDPVPGLLLVGVGELELVDGATVAGVVGSGEFLFPGEVLGAGAAPRTARAGAGGALILFGDRMIAQELLVTCPPLLEVFAGM